MAYVALSHPTRNQHRRMSDQSQAYTYLDRETSWLRFNGRVLQEADDPSVPLFERLFFCGIFSSNLDEYFRVRVASLRSLLRMGKAGKAKLGIDPHRLLHDIHRIVQEQQERYGAQLGRIFAALESAGIRRVDEATVDRAHRDFLRCTFEDTVRPLIEPIRLTEKPFLENNTIYLVVELWDKARAELDSWTPGYVLLRCPPRLSVASWSSRPGTAAKSCFSTTSSASTFRRSSPATRSAGRTRSSSHATRSSISRTSSRAIWWKRSARA
jgi:polyphosphate kinase